MRARFLSALLAAVGLLGCETTSTGPQHTYKPSFITDGSLDGNAHPAVALLVMDIAGRPASPRYPSPGARRQGGHSRRASRP